MVHLTVQWLHVDWPVADAHLQQEKERRMECRNGGRMVGIRKGRQAGRIVGIRKGMIAGRQIM
jgi:hypothetical protein